MFSGVASEYEQIFERGIDPDVDNPSKCHPHSLVPTEFPSVQDVKILRDEIRQQVTNALGQVSGHDASDHELAVSFLTGGGHGASFSRHLLGLQDNMEAYIAFMHSCSRMFHMVLEHERMHQHVPPELKQTVPPVQYDLSPSPIVPAGVARLGRPHTSSEFGWDCEFPEQVHTDAFLVGACAITIGGFQQESLWTPDDWAWVQQEDIAHPATWEQSEVHSRVPMEEAVQWPVFVCLAMARAYVAWRFHRDDMRLIMYTGVKYRIATEAEMHRVQWGDADGSFASEYTPANANINFTHWAPTPVGSYPRNARGVYDAVGNGWELTETVFGPLPGFRPFLLSYPGYSADFFDGKHYVVVGASFGTDAVLVRPSFRNWYQAHYTHMHAKFRLVISNHSR